jgi:hypothetical protein
MKGKDYINRGMISPKNYDDIDYTGYEAYDSYLAWSKFTSSYPYNAELLIKLFGERDAMQVFRYMAILPETKARELVERLRYTVVHKKKLKNMSDS